MNEATDSPTSDALPSSLAPHLPHELFGAVRSVTPISIGLSGAGVYAVTTETGDFVLRITPRHEVDSWSRQLAVLRLAAQHGIAPSLVHVDEAACVTVSTRIASPHMGMVLTDPSTRNRTITSLVQQVATLHAIPGDGIESFDPPAVAHALWRQQSARKGFPVWALPFDEVLERSARIVARDPRRVLSHNDLNPGNLLWDGTRIWLVDWSAAGMVHPYYDLATFSVFLQLADAAALALLSAQEGAVLTDEQAETFRAFRRVAAINCGLMFIRMTPDDALHTPERAEDAPTMAQCYGQMRSGALDLQSGAGQCAFGLALLRSALD